jgi:hypothetical protein
MLSPPGLIDQFTNFVLALAYLGMVGVPTLYLLLIVRGSVKMFSTRTRVDSDALVNYTTHYWFVAKKDSVYILQK